MHLAEGTETDASLPRVSPRTNKASLHSPRDVLRTPPSYGGVGSNSKGGVGGSSDAVSVEARTPTDQCRVAHTQEEIFWPNQHRVVSNQATSDNGTTEIIRRSHARRATAGAAAPDIGRLPSPGRGPLSAEWPLCPDKFSGLRARCHCH